MTRVEKFQELLDTSKYFKLVCGAGNEDFEEIKRLTLIYTLAGVKGLDISANPESVKACMEGIELAFSLSEKLNPELKTRPYITVSVGMPGDNHVRKASINDNCVSCKECIATCPTSAISEDLIVNHSKCIGCGNCFAACPNTGAISFQHNEKVLDEILPKCMEAGAENIELHAAVEDDTHIMREWTTINRINPNNHVSMCLDRLHLSDFALERRIRKAHEISGGRLIIQADGYPMSGGVDDYNTTLQAVAIADVINKRFNMIVDSNSKKLVYRDKDLLNILLSGGTNSVTSELANKCNVKFQGVSIGTFARKLVKAHIDSTDFYDNPVVIQEATTIARSLVVKSIGEIHE